jgi:hypothetical protein
MNRGIAALASALMVSFLLLTLFDRQFFLLHFYEASIYLVILLLLFFFHERWAYMIGILAPAGWLLLAYGMGFLGGAMRQVRHVLVAHEAATGAGLVAAAIFVLAVGMIALCFYRWRREFANLRGGWSTFLASLAIVACYYGALVFWFFRILAAGGREYGG